MSEVTDIVENTPAIQRSLADMAWDRKLVHELEGGEADDESRYDIYVLISNT
jgi:hypothetical protein